MTFTSFSVRSIACGTVLAFSACCAMAATLVTDHTSHSYGKLTMSPGMPTPPLPPHGNLAMSPGMPTPPLPPHGNLAMSPGMPTPPLPPHGNLTA